MRNVVEAGLKGTSSRSPLLGVPIAQAAYAYTGHSLPTYCYAVNNPLAHVDRNGLAPEELGPAWDRASDVQRTVDAPDKALRLALAVSALRSCLSSRNLSAWEYSGRAGLSAAGGTMLALRAPGIGGGVTSLGFGMACSMACTK